MKTFAFLGKKTSSLISSHTCRLSPAKVFALDMRKLLKPIKSDEKIYLPSVHI